MGIREYVTEQITKLNERIEQLKKNMMGYVYTKCFSDAKRLIDMIDLCTIQRDIYLDVLKHIS